MGLRAPAKWKKYHTGLFPWQLPEQTKRLRVTALCPSLPPIARCAQAPAGRSIPPRAIKLGATSTSSCFVPQNLASVNDYQGSFVCLKLEFREWFCWELCARFAN